MEVPEKLYVSVGDAILDIYSKKESNEEIEYIRTDAFIEKACEWLEQNVKIILCGDKIDTDKFIEGFKKAMKL